jgi:hypothetical protein
MQNLPVKLPSRLGSGNLVVGKRVFISLVFFLLFFLGVQVAESGVIESLEATRNELKLPVTQVW